VGLSTPVFKRERRSPGEAPTKEDSRLTSFAVEKRLAGMTAS
jgi:hypothetical protein